MSLIQNYGRIENLPREIKSKIETQNYEEVRKFFLQPKLTDDYYLSYGELQENELFSFLCDERDFSVERVKTAIQRMKTFYAGKMQTELKEWHA
jgi:flap endonuclease-1